MSQVAKKTDKKKLWLTEGVIIGASPVVGYIVTFIYEISIAQVFEIPFEFITLNLLSILIATGGFVLLFGGLVAISSDILFSFSHFKPKFKQLPWTFLPSLLFASVVLGIHPRSIEMWIMAGILLGLSVLCWLILRFLSDDETKEVREETSFFEQLDQIISRGSILIIVLWVGFAFLIPFLLGRAKAELQEKFIVIPTSPEMVVLRVYGDKLIAAHFDRETKQIERGFFVRTIGNDPKQMFYLEKVGPLRLRKEDKRGRR